MSLCLNKKVEAELRALPGNNICCDCNDRNPQWASVSFGVFMCLECSGRHRALGVHISFVRSVSMDSWNQKQIDQMRKGGNEKCIEFLKQYNVPKTMPIQQKYNTPAALLYKDRLQAEMEGRPLPTELPTSKSSGNNGSQTIQGSEPLPGESEADYIARQRRLQAEAKERMRQKFGNSSGLSSKGNMMGIGSDPNYNPNSSNTDFDIADVTQTAFSFIASSAKALGDKVAEVSKQLTDENGIAFSTGGSSNNKNQDSGWGKLGASVWSTLTDATNNVVDIVRPHTEDDYKFPRPDNYSGATPTSQTGVSNHGMSSVSSMELSEPSNAGGKNCSWDRLDDMLSGNDKMKSTSANVSSSYSDKNKSISSKVNSSGTLSKDNNTTNETLTSSASNRAQSSSSLYSSDSNNSDNSAKIGKKAAKKLAVDSNDNWDDW